MPYILCALAFSAVGVAASLTRGDRVMRLGMIGAVVTALPWALCQGLAAMATDSDTATRLLRLGQGPVALVGPNLLLLLLAVGGRLERFRWVARVSGIIGAVFVGLAWATDLVVPSVHRLDSGLYYMSPGPLTTVHLTQLVLWLLIGIAIVRRSAPRAEQRRTMRLLLGILVLGAISSVDTLLLYGSSTPWGSFPVAWLPSLLAAVVALYMVVRTDILRPQGLDRGMAIELATFVGAGGGAIVLALFFVDSSFTLAATTSITWAGLVALAWGIERARPAQVTEQRALDKFVARMTKADNGTRIVDRITQLWHGAIGIEVRTIRWGDTLDLSPELAAWFVAHPQPFAVTELATMQLKGMRTSLEALGKNDPNGLIVPLVDRDELVGLVEAHYGKALRDAERELVVESAKAAARAFAFVALARAAARENETAREVEIADALRLRAAASRDAELGPWAVAAEYRPGTRTTGAGWSAVELGEGKLALLVTEARTHGVPAALATAGLAGAFAAATTGPIALAELAEILRAESVAAFVAILDATTIEWACIGHPGAFLVGPVVELAAGSVKTVRPSATRLAETGSRAWPADMLLVVTSSALGDDAERLRDLAPASGRLASTLVAKATNPADDALAVVVRAR